MHHYPHFAYEDAEAGGVESKFKFSLGHQLWSMALAMLLKDSSSPGSFQRNGDKKSVSGRKK